MEKIVLLFILLSCALPVLAYDTKSDIYTLYRSSPLNANMRIHIATFDSKEKNLDGLESYNMYNCNLAASLFQAQQGVVSKFWCEKGKFKP